MKKRIGLVFLVLVLMAAAVAGCQQKIGDGQYDYSYASVDMVGSEPSSLTDRVRAVEVRGYFEGEYKTSSFGCAFIYNEKYVIIPKQLFDITISQGFVVIERSSALVYPGFSVKVFLLSDPEKENNWKEEQLGEVLNKDDVIEGLANFVIVERIDPLIEIPSAEYTIGKYEDLKAGNVLYRVSQDNIRHIIVSRAEVVGLRKSGGKDVIEFEAHLSTRDLGGLLFAVRDGKFELVGFLCILESVPGSFASQFLALDIGEIADYIKTHLP